MCSHGAWCIMIEVESSTHHAIADPQQSVELELRAIAKQEDVFSVLVARVGAVGEVLRSLHHRVKCRRKCLAAAWSQQGHPRCFNEPLEVFQCRANGTTVPVFLLRTLQISANA